MFLKKKNKSFSLQNNVTVEDKIPPNVHCMHSCILFLLLFSYFDRFDLNSHQTSDDDTHPKLAVSRETDRPSFGQKLTPWVIGYCHRLPALCVVVGFQ